MTIPVRFFEHAEALEFALGPADPCCRRSSPSVSNRLPPSSERREPGLRSGHCRRSQTRGLLEGELEARARLNRSGQRLPHGSSSAFADALGDVGVGNAEQTMHLRDFEQTDGDLLHLVGCELVCDPE